MLPRGTGSPILTPDPRTRPFDDSGLICVHLWRPNSGSVIARRVGHSCFLEPLLSQKTAITSPTSPALLIGVVATVRHCIIHAKLNSPANDLGLGEMNERRVDGEWRAARRGHLRR